jgi:hypothetical protein
MLFQWLDLRILDQPRDSFKVSACRTALFENGHETRGDFDDVLPFTASYRRSQSSANLTASKANWRG